MRKNPNLGLWKCLHQNAQVFLLNTEQQVNGIIFDPQQISLQTTQKFVFV